MTALALRTAIFVILGALPAAANTTELIPLPVSQDTASKPQSKVWAYAGSWWAVLPSTAESPSGTWLWQLQTDMTWGSALHLSAATDTRADVKLDGDLAHVLLHGASPELVSLEYSAVAGSYVPWTTRPVNTPVALPGSETGSLAIDSTGRIWIAANSGAFVHAHYADSPYSSFTGPIVLASGIDATDDIAAVIALPVPAVGVFWSNQITQRFGFRVHFDSDPPATWQADEVPVSQSALAQGAGMADDHMNLTVGTDGTLYVAIKTSYDTPGFPQVSLLVRRPNGVWDDLYEVDRPGTRALVLLNEAAGLLHVVYAADGGLADIIVRETSTSSINFGPSSTLIEGSWSNATSTPQLWGDEVAVLASDGSTVSGVLTDFQPCAAELPGLLGHWGADEGPGGSLSDTSVYGSDAAIVGIPTWVAGQQGLGVAFDGDDYAMVSNRCELNITSAISLAAWIRPTTVATQRIIRRVSGSKGFSLFLSAGGKVSVRFNDMNSLRVDSLQDYPADGIEWMHIAATYDGSVIKLYINGVLEDQLSASFDPTGSEAPLSIGAEATGSNPFEGTLDEIRVYSYALSESEVQLLESNAVPVLPWWSQALLAQSLLVSGLVAIRPRMRAPRAAQTGGSSGRPSGLRAITLSLSS